MPQQARSSYAAAAEILDLTRAPLRRVVDFRLSAADSAMLPARLHSYSGGIVPAMLYLHGGGFVIASLETHDSLCRQLALRSGGAVVALDYRLAPKYRFAAAVDDAWAALRWLHARGGALAAVCAQRAARARFAARAAIAGNA